MEPTHWPDDDRDDPRDMGQVKSDRELSEIQQEVNQITSTLERSLKVAVVLIERLAPVCDPAIPESEKPRKESIPRSSLGMELRSLSRLVERLHEALESMLSRLAI